MGDIGLSKFLKNLCRCDVRLSSQRKVVTVYTIACGGVELQLVIFNFDTRRRQVVSYASWPSYPHGQRSCFPPLVGRTLYRRKNLSLFLGIEPRFFCLLARSLCTIPPTLHRCRCLCSVYCVISAIEGKAIPVQSLRVPGV